MQDGKGDADLGCDAGHEQLLPAGCLDSLVEAVVVHGVDDARSLDARRELVRQNLCKLGNERTLNPVFHARRQHRRQSRRLGDPGELESILLDEVDVVGMRPGHRADLVVNQQHRGAGGCKDGFVHFELLNSASRS